MMLGAGFSLFSDSLNTVAAEAHDARCRVGPAFNTAVADAHDARCRVGLSNTLR